MILSAILTCTLMSLPQVTLAQNYPAKPVRLIVGFAAGGNNDVPARIVAAKVAEIWGVPLIVENKPGAGGTVGTDFVAKAKADGYTLANCNSATHGVNPAIYKSLPYDAVKDFAPISLIGTAPNVLLVGPSSPIKTLREFITYAKSNPGKVSIGTAGIGSTQHFSMELLQSLTGTDMLHVPYKGGALAIGDLVGGQIPATISGLPTAMTLIKSGKVRAIGITSTKRSPQLPEVPTFAESGVPGYEIVTWTGICAPAGTPKPLVAKIQSDIAKALEMPETKRLLAQQGIDAVSSTPEQISDLIRTEVAKFAKLQKNARIPQE
jgi:tripartite-type tricarboxylate transporter receptor subunit TctC